jgi:hypothetical protein
MPNRADCERSSVDFSPRQSGGRSFIPQTIFGQRGCLSSSSSLAVRGRQKHGRRCLGVLTTTPAVTPRLVDVYYTLIPDCIRAYQYLIGAAAYPTRGKDQRPRVLFHFWPTRCYAYGCHASRDLTTPRATGTPMSPAPSSLYWSRPSSCYRTNTTIPCLWCHGHEVFCLSVRCPLDMHTRCRDQGH